MIGIACADVGVGMCQHWSPVVEVVALTLSGMGLIRLIIVGIVMLFWVYRVLSLALTSAGILRKVVKGLLGGVNVSLLRR